MGDLEYPSESKQIEEGEQAARWPERTFPSGKAVVPVNTGSAMGSKNNPPLTDDIPDSDHVAVEREGEGFDPRNS